MADANSNNVQNIAAAVDVGNVLDQVEQAEAVLFGDRLPGGGGGSDDENDPPEPPGWDPVRAATQESCVFCLESLFDGRKVLLLLPCRHYVHAECK